MFIKLTMYGSTNQVRVNINNVTHYKTIKVDSVPSQTHPGYREVHKTGVYFQNNPVPVVVEEDVIMVDGMIYELLSSNT